jgi:hypothetical protein
MPFDYDIAVKVTVPLATLILGKYLDRWFSKRPKVVAFYSHSS